MSRAPSLASHDFWALLKARREHWKVLGSSLCKVPGRSFWNVQLSKYRKVQEFFSESSKLPRKCLRDNFKSAREETSTASKNPLKPNRPLFWPFEWLMRNILKNRNDRGLSNLSRKGFSSFVIFFFFFNVEWTLNVRSGETHTRSLSDTCGNSTNIVVRRNVMLRLILLARFLRFYVKLVTTLSQGDLSPTELIVPFDRRCGNLC